MGNRLLLADDSITIQKVVAIIFANEEFELTVVDNGTAALEKAREIQPDVMLIDALMPGKTGYEVCAEIRRDPKLNAVPILLLIGAFEPLDEEKARDCGADASISKPFESQQLIDRVKEMLEMGKSRKAAPVAAAAAQPLPIESAAEELWGDLSSFDTMPPTLVAPAAALPKEDSVWDMAAPVAPVAAAPGPVEEEMVEAGSEDDLWGAFEMEEAPSAPAAPPAQLFGAVEPETDFEAEEFFSFDDEAEGIEETGPALELEPAEEAFSFSQDARNVVEPLASREPEPEPFDFTTEDEPLALEPEELEPEELELAAPLAAAPVAPEAAREPEAKAPAAAGLSEAELVAALSKISREVIERIVWEVVPDLAEALIKEEIKKLKAGLRG